MTRMKQCPLDMTGSCAHKLTACGIDTTNKVSQRAWVDEGGAHKAPSLAEEVWTFDWLLGREGQFSLSVRLLIVDHTARDGPVPMSLWATQVTLLAIKWKKIKGDMKLGDEGDVGR